MEMDNSESKINSVPFDINLEEAVLIQQSQIEENENHNDKKGRISFIFDGILSFFANTEYFICIFFLKTLLASNSVIEDSDAAGYVTGYFSLTYFALLYGILETLVTYTTQLENQKNAKKINLIYRQALIIFLLVLFLLCLPGCFLLKYGLRLLRIEEIVI